MIRAADFPSPTAFGAPARFDHWRDAQADAEILILQSSKRFTGISAPTGIGKSLIAVMVQKMTGLRVCILAPTRALQDQYQREWSEAGLFDMRGQENYECEAVRDGGPLARYHRGGSAVMVDRAPCHAGVWCPLKHRGGCGYYDDLRAAASAVLVLTNYAFWIAAGPSLGHFDYLVMDEADEADAEVRKALHIELSHPRVRQWLSMDPLAHNAPAAEWRDWAGGARRRCGEVIGDYTDDLMRDEAIDQQSVYELRQLKELESTLGRIRNLEGKWLIAPSRRGPITDFDPVWPGPYCEEMLYRGIERIVMMSATLTRKDMSILGVPEPQSEFREYDSPFPVANRPVYILDFGANSVRVDHRLKDFTWLIGLMDSAISQRLDRKILISVPSYKLTKLIVGLSRYRHLMVSYETSDGKPETLADFRSAVAGGPNSIIVGPSLRIGESFPMTQCETILIPKIPFVDMRDPIMKLRKGEDPDYDGHLMMKSLAQAAGRHVRSLPDRGETLIFDDHARWAIRKYRKYASKAFLKAIKWTSMIPKPLPKL